MKYLLICLVSFVSFPTFASEAKVFKLDSLEYVGEVAALPGDLQYAKERSIAVIERHAHAEYKRINGVSSKYKVRADGIDYLYSKGYKQEAIDITEEAQMLPNAELTDKFIKEVNVYYKLLVPREIFQHASCCFVCC